MATGKYYIALRCSVLALCLATLAGTAGGQRVQLPTSNMPGGFGPPQAAYGQPSLGAPMYASPPVNLGPPPAFDSYNSGGLAPPATAMPYGAAPALPQTYAVPQQGYSGAYAAPAGPAVGFDGSTSGGWLSGDTFSGGAVPFGWESGTYGYQQPAAGAEFGGEGTVVRFKRFLQQLSFEQTYLLGDHSDEAFSLVRTEVFSIFAYPLFGNLDRPLLITPGFAFNWWEGPLGDPAVDGDPNLPPRVYDAYLDTAWYPQLSERFSLELGIRSGVWTDFHNLDGDAVRVLGRGLGVLKVSPTMDVLAGVVYLDRVRVKLLPAGGFRFRPNDLWDIYAVFPNPTVRRRMQSASTVDWWWYVSGEYGGGSWSLEREGKGDDRVDYNDMRVVLGLEWETQRQVRGHLEIGYVFDREIIFGDTEKPPIFIPDTTVMFRGGIDY